LLRANTTTTTTTTIIMITTIIIMIIKQLLDETELIRPYATVDAIQTNTQSVLKANSNSSSDY